MTSDLSSSRSPAAFHRTVDTETEAATLACAGRLGAALRPGDVIALVGDLGAGKTAFTRGICSGLGLSPAYPVSSPTYVLEQVYPARIEVRHYDAYRLASVDEFLDLGFADFLQEKRSIQIVEWADRVDAVLPASTLRVHIEFLPGVDADPTVPSTRRQLVFSSAETAWAGRTEDALSSPSE